MLLKTKQKGVSIAGCDARGVFLGAALLSKDDVRVANIELCAVVSRFRTAMRSRR
jgi:hypothetical protein